MDYPLLRQPPRNGEDLGGQDPRCIHCLAELPVGQICGASQGVKVILGTLGRSVASGLEPGFGPTDVVVTGGGLDWKFFDSTKESQPLGRGRRTGLNLGRLTGHGILLRSSGEHFKSNFIGMGIDYGGWSHVAPAGWGGVARGTLNIEGKTSYFACQLRRTDC